MNRTVTAVAGVALVVTALTGCSHHDKKQPDDVVVVQPAPGPSDTLPTPDPTNTDDVPAAAAKAAQAFLTVRENVNSARHATANDAIASFKPVTSATGFKQVTAGFDPNGNLGGQWAAGHKGGYTVRVETSCTKLPDGSGGKYLALQCSLTDTTLGKDGKPPMEGTIPVQWVYQGKQPTVTLALVKNGTGWLVDADVTGQAN